MKLAEYLKTENIKPSHLASRLAVSPSTITRLAKERRVPSLDLAKKIAAATGGRVTLDDFPSKVAAQSSDEAA